MGWLVVGAMLVLGAPAAMYLAQDNLLFLPQPFVGPPRIARPVEPLGFGREDGVTVRGWFVKAPGGPAPLVVYYGGNAEEVSWQMAEPWPADWALALVNYRGYGESGGKPVPRRRSSPMRSRCSTRSRAAPTSTGRGSCSSAAASVRASQPTSPRSGRSRRWCWSRPTTA